MECAKAALAVCKDSKPILDGATPANWEAMNEVAKENGVVLGVWAESISDLYDTVKKLEAAGNKNLVLDVTGKTAKETLAMPFWSAVPPSRTVTVASVIPLS